MSDDVYLREHPNPHARQYTSPRKAEPSGVIAVHTAENTPDYIAFDGGAEAVARFISTRTDPGSYHSLCDSDSIVRLVRYQDSAWHDGTGTNPHSFGVSGATRADVWPLAPKAWRDGCIDNMARASADYAKWIHAEYGVVIPPVRILASQARARVPGFVDHARLDPGRRTDPGDEYPWDQFFTRYEAHMGTDTEEFTMDAEVAEAFAAVHAKLDRIIASERVNTARQLENVRGTRRILIKLGLAKPKA